MKKIKLLMPTVLVTQALTILPLTLTSCGNSTPQISIYTPEGSNEISGNETSNILYLNLSNKLNDGESISCNLLTSGVPFEFQKEVKVWNNIGIVTYSKTNECVANKHYSIELEFVCNDKANKQKWKLNASTTIVYTDHVSYTGIKEQWTDTTSYSGSYTYKFNLTEKLSSDNKIKVNINRTSGSDNVYASADLNPTVSEDRKSIEVNVGLAKQISSEQTKPDNGEYVDFDVKFICVDSNETEKWSKTIKGFKLLYSAQNVLIPNDAFVMSTETGKEDTLSKIDFSKITTTNSSVCNTLSIPHKFTTETNQDVTINAIDDNFWANSISGLSQEKLAIANNIKTLVVKWDTGCCRKIGKQAFKNSNLEVIDVSEIPNKVQGLQSIFYIEPNDSSTGKGGAFEGFENKTGSVKWGTDFSQYKKHIIKTKLYQAGIGQGWFDTMQVSTREQLVEALDSGAAVKLMSDIDLSTTNYCGQIDVYTSSIIDLNGHKLYSSKPIYNDSAYQYSLLRILNGVELVISDSVGTGEIKPYDSAKEYTGLSTRAIDIVTDHPASSVISSLEILGGKFYGNKNIFMNKYSNVYIEGGEYELLQVNTQLPQQLRYSNMLAVDSIEKAPTNNKWYSNYYVYAGKFIGEYNEGSYSSFKGTSTTKTEQFKISAASGSTISTYNYKDIEAKGWIKPLSPTEQQSQIVWPYYNEKLTMPAMKHNDVPATPKFIDVDECFANPFFTVSPIARIQSSSGTESDTKKYWWSWKPEDDNYNFYIQYNQHEETSKNSIVISCIYKS